MISIIIVTNDNRQTKLISCLEALKKQTYKNFETIIVHSTEKYSEIDKNFNVKNIVQNGKGISNARNEGIKSATGEIIAFTDDDAIPCPDWIQSIYEAFKANPELSYLGGDFVGKPRNAFQRWTNRRTHFKPNQTILCHGNNMAYKRTIFNIIQFNENIIFGFDEAELQNNLHRLGFKCANFPKIKICHQHDDTFRSFTKTHISYQKGKSHVYQKLRREQFSFEDILNILFLISIFYTITLSIIPIAISILLFLTIAIRLSYLYKGNTNPELLLIDFYISFLLTLSKIYFPLKRMISKRRR